MLLVKTKIESSKIHGTGLFADEFIPKGSIIWQFDPKRDRAYTRKDVELLPESERSEVLSLFHSYISNRTGRYIAHGDENSNYFNHSFTPNVEGLYKEGVEECLCVAARDIEPEEELTMDYRSFAEEGIDFDLHDSAAANF